MSVLIIVGAQWGDEGKGKIVDFLSSDYEFIARFQGGNNAGHTLKVDGKVFKLHLVPSGVVRPGKTLVIGNGTVLDLDVLRKEIGSLEEGGIIDIDLRISDRAHVIMPYHRYADGRDEHRRGGKFIGTTGRGIGPAYMDKVGRRGIRMCDLGDEDTLREKAAMALSWWSRTSGWESADVSGMDPDDIVSVYMDHGKFFRPMIENVASTLARAIDNGKNVLFEGAQGALLDVDFGTYPYVTSSHTVTGGGPIGTGVPPTKIGKIVGVVKAYTTRVGEGPFPTELFDGTGELLGKHGGEFGTTTGRPRRCGWLDLVALRYTAMIGGMTHLAITKIDVLDGLPEIKVCTHYEIDGNITDEFPANLRRLSRARPVYTSLPGDFGLDEGTMDELRSGRIEEIPDRMSNYLAFIEENLGIPIEIISFGAGRVDTCVVPGGIRALR